MEISINETLRDDELRSILGKLESDQDNESFGLVCKRWLHMQSFERRASSACAEPHILRRIAARFSGLHELDLSQSVSRSFYTGVTDSDLAVIAGGFASLRVLNLRNCKDEFKPASIDKTKAGSMKKTKENRVSVEFQNNQIGKPKVTFEGSSEDYKESDAVLFFDGEKFRLERLHRAVKQLRHLRKPGESSAAAPVIEPRLSPPPAKAPKITRTAFPTLPVEVERIDIGGSENPGSRSASKGVISEEPKKENEKENVNENENEKENEKENENENEEHQDIDIEDIFGAQSDDEIADVDDSGDEVDKGPNAAEALRAQVNAEERSSSSSSSGSATATSGSTSSSTDSEASDEDSVNSI